MLSAGQGRPSLSIAGVSGRTARLLAATSRVRPETASLSTSATRSSASSCRLRAKRRSIAGRDGQDGLPRTATVSPETAVSRPDCATVVQGRTAGVGLGAARPATQTEAAGEISRTAAGRYGAGVPEEGPSRGTAFVVRPCRRRASCSETG